MGDSSIEQNIITGDPLGLWEQHPTEWQEHRLWDIAEYINGRAFKPTDFSAVGLSVIKITELKNGLSPSTSLYNGEYEEKYLLNTGDLLFAWSGNPETSLDAYRWKGKKALLNQHIFRVVPHNNIDKTYLFFLLKYLRPTFIRTARDKATSMGHVKISDLKRLVAFIPPLSEQKAIASILGALDDKIELNRKMNETLEAMARAIFKSWFVGFDPIPSLGHHKEWQDSPLGMIPKGWRVVQLKEIAQFVKGISYKSEDLQESDIALVTLKSIARGGGYQEEGLKPYTGDFKPEQQVQQGEVVVAHTDLTQAAEVLGRAARVRVNPRFSKLIASLDLVIVRPSEQWISNEFLYELLLRDEFQEHAYGYANGTTVLHLSVKALPEYRFVLPRPDIIEAFTKSVQPIYFQIDQNISQFLTLSAVRDVLLSKLLSGDIRVKDAERLVYL